MSDGKPTVATGTLLVTINDTTAQKLQYGDELLIPAKYNAVDPPFNPAEFNYKQYLANQNIYQQTYLYPGQYRVIAHGKGNPLIAYALKLRRHLVEKLKVNIHDTSAVNVASTLILGYKVDLSSDLLQAYSKTGTIHILSVSGGHVAVIYLLLNILLGFIGRYKHGKLIKAILTISLIWYYALLTGLSPAVCRAAVMISLIIIGKTYSRYINTLNILAVSAFFLLLYNPFYISDVGFQLSYLSVAGMIILQPMVYGLLGFKNRWADKLWAACSVSIAAQVITFPLAAFYFHQFPVYFLISNLFIILPAELILFTGIFYLALPQIVFVSASLGWILEKSILIMNKVLLVIEQAPFASINKIWFNTAEYILAYAIIICMAYYFFNRKMLLLRLALVLLFVLAISSSFKKFKSISSNSIVFLNLRKHSGIVFKQGDKAIILSDLACTDKNYRYSIQPYLDSSKVTDTSVYTLAQNIVSPYLLKHGNIIRFNHVKVLIFNKPLQNVRLPDKLKVDYIYLTDNPHATITGLTNNYQFKTLIIGGNNNDQLITDWEKQAADSRAKYYCLKRNISYISLSN
ncbi:ComEC/Rec2 family competence protein [Mucilaginibacter panaciglaebae]|uniref:ComEC/Rec2 family competence protein n=2 Tax=Mucilaginibacter panaciglaebae TaxID=502331 RepID=A0ABP7WJE3_9SPHI